MKLEDPQHPWSRLIAAARWVRDERDTSAPYGFATRVAALAYARDGKVASFLDRYAWRAVGVSGLLALLSVAMNYRALTSQPVAVVAIEDYTVQIQDPVSLFLDVAE